MYQVRGNRFYMYKNNKINERKVMLTHSGSYLSNSIAVRTVHNVYAYCREIQYCLIVILHFKIYLGLDEDRYKSQDCLSC